MSLRADETIQRLLISSKARLIAEYESENLFISHAWPNGATGRQSETAAYVISFRTPPLIKEVGVTLPNFDPAGEFYCSLASLLYGKHFEDHGLIQSNGGFGKPNFNSAKEFRIASLAQNSQKARDDISVPLDWRQFGRFNPLFEGELDTVSKAFISATKFYWQALRTAESFPEVAYLHLITSGEVLSNAHLAENEHRIDEELEEIIREISDTLPDGKKKANTIRSKMFSVRRRFRTTLEDFIDDDFFGPDLATNPLCLRPEELKAAIAAAYDLRSKHLHSGASFGTWLAAGSGEHQREKLFGIPNTDPEIAKLLSKAPTYPGLERMVRYALIRFAEKNRLLSKVE